MRAEAMNRNSLQPGEAEDYWNASSNGQASVGGGIPAIGSYPMLPPSYYQAPYEAALAGSPALPAKHSAGQMPPSHFFHRGRPAMEGGPGQNMEVLGHELQMTGYPIPPLPHSSQRGGANAKAGRPGGVPNLQGSLAMGGHNGSPSLQLPHPVGHHRYPPAGLPSLPPHAVAAGSQDGAFKGDAFLGVSPRPDDPSPRSKGKKSKAVLRGTLSDIKPKKRFIWSDSLHQEFIAGVFDVGLKAVNEEILRHMLTAHESYRTVMFAQLQRLRHFRYQYRAVQALRNPGLRGGEGGGEGGGPKGGGGGKPAGAAAADGRPAAKRKRPGAKPEPGAAAAAAGAGAGAAGAGVDLSDPGALAARLRARARSRAGGALAGALAEALGGQEAWRRRAARALAGHAALQARAAAALTRGGARRERAAAAAAAAAEGEGGGGGGGAGSGPDDDHGYGSPAGGGSGGNGGGGGRPPPPLPPPAQDAAAGLADLGVALHRNHGGYRRRYSFAEDLAGFGGGYAAAAARTYHPPTGGGGGGAAGAGGGVDAGGAGGGRLRRPSFGAAARAKEAYLRQAGLSELPEDLRELRALVPGMGSGGGGGGPGGPNGPGGGAAHLEEARYLPSWTASEEHLTMEMESQMNLHRQMLLQKQDQVAKYEEGGEKDSLRLLRAARAGSGSGGSGGGSTPAEHLEWLLQDETLDEQLFDFLVDSARDQGGGGGGGNGGNNSGPIGGDGNKGGGGGGAQPGEGKPRGEEEEGATGAGPGCQPKGGSGGDGGRGEQQKEANALGGEQPPVAATALATATS